jgi:hypothetical protein
VQFLVGRPISSLNKIRSLDVHSQTSWSDDEIGKWARQILPVNGVRRVALCAFLRESLRLPYLGLYISQVPPMCERTRGRRMRSKHGF